jgi:ubiquinone/menaquinone biosynthesis C-methylase UbiE
MLIDELSGCKVVLDAGVGTGRFAKPLQDNGFEVFGVDISKKMIGQAIEKGAKNLLVGDVCLLPFKDNSFDAAVCVHILHLISEWGTALREICRATRGTMMTIFYANKDPIREAYDTQLAEYGFASRRLGKSEWELKDLVKPRKSVFVASYSSNADRRLSLLGQRAYSGQWEIPEEVNKKVVDKLKEVFAGKTFPQELRVLVWDVQDLRAYCECGLSR